MPEIRGSCLCGGVKSAISGPILGSANWQDDDPGLAPALHVFVADKAPWSTITDDLPQFAQMPGEEAVRDFEGPKPFLLNSPQPIR